MATVECRWPEHRAWEGGVPYWTGTLGLRAPGKVKRLQGSLAGGCSLSLGNLGGYMGACWAVIGVNMGVLR